MSTTQANVQGDTEMGDGPVLSDKEMKAQDEANHEKFDERYELYSYVLPNGDKTPEWQQSAENAIKVEISKDFLIYEKEIVLLLQWIKKNDTTGDESQMKERALLLAKSSVIYGVDISKHSTHNDPLKSLEDELETQATEQESYELGDRPSGISDQAWSERRQKMIKQQDEDDSEEAQAAEKKREAHINKGIKEADPLEKFKSMDSVVQAVREDIPKNVLPLHKTMCVLILHWWESGLTKEDSIRFNAINSRLDTIEDGQSYKVAPTEIDLWLNNLRTCITECEEAPNEDRLSRLVGTAITLTNRLRKAGLDWKMVIGKDTHRRVLRCLRDSSSTEVQKQLALFEASYLYVRKKQLEYLDGCIDMVLPFMLTEDGKIREATLPLCIEQIKCLNTKLGERNIQIGLRRSDHNIPINDLEAAVRCARVGRPMEAMEHIANLHYKMNLLNIPGLESLEQVCKGINVDTQAAQDEVMDLPKGLEPSQFVEDVPLLKRFSRTYAYEGVEMKTVGWGDHNGRFFINQYGPRDAPIWRKERHPSSEWATNYGDGDPPDDCKITSTARRFGDMRHTTTGKKIYGPKHVGGVYGVAFEPTDDSLSILDPDRCDSSNGSNNGSTSQRIPSVYVLIGWDLDLTGKDLEKRWEPRSALRERWGKKDADISIFEAATDSQKAFKQWKNGCLKSRDETSEVIGHNSSRSQASTGRVMRSTDEEEKPPRGSVTPAVADNNHHLPIRRRRH
ncbi:hypothetical protein COCC4DRAFT_43932 [Bipolaris maydis ATCC 48331]|uniref:Uncharacterized protein n=3 Tax=Cochliobolus heterostrophus TaxID=5016 RepID=M2UGM6_COCH5|nr:uncharacterized protein COCC4DRAFT_43932 [Bipolaris maydis ATCC 48331]EMD97594.1 hypothetical protein COCHEDRAFT_1025987 [Bipolaris maydis C5]KAJ5031707.1 hypothetical protein J3E73DRAFT_179757 [Bipolaris maydis]ENI01092.1 hypothetical protein COCC4DRAFT_43932 [Bipolaris maydis ATCC 48331]KAJ5060242.1 hypothetical protein J3E74DRAFT_290523 [Bipolaris maydis]KAJ6211041.1 hypothetical protein PSV09DRAFT_1025987 [Bipolaris maydis]